MADDFIQTLPLEPHPELAVTYSVYPQYEKRICGNCKWFNKTGNEKTDYPICDKLTNEHSGLASVCGDYTWLRVQEDFGCVLWEAKKSEGEG